MKKSRWLLSTLFLLFIVSQVHAQRAVHYGGGVIQCVTFENSKPVDTTLLGLDVAVTYDAGSDSYLISYRNQDDQLKALALDYISQQGKSKRMRQKGTHVYFLLVDQQLSAEGMLLLRQEQDDPAISILITGLRVPSAQR